MIWDYECFKVNIVKGLYFFDDWFCFKDLILNDMRYLDLGFGIVKYWLDVYCIYDIDMDIWLLCLVFY